MQMGDTVYDGKPGAVSVPCPTWCFDRFGQTRTELPDGRVVFVAGEHEDWYDPDFCIYNDVIVLDTNIPFGPDAIKIYGYPPHVFPPTDTHTATYYCQPKTGDQYIFMVGGQGYGLEGADPHKNETTVYRLDLSNFMVEKMETTGKKPGYALVNHRASLVEYFEHKRSNWQLFPRKTCTAYARITTSTRERNMKLDEKRQYNWDSGLCLDDHWCSNSEEEKKPDSFVEVVYHLNLATMEWITGEIKYGTLLAKKLDSPHVSGQNEQSKSFVKLKKRWKSTAGRRFLVAGVGVMSMAALWKVLGGA